MRGVKRRRDNKWKRVVVFLILVLVFGVLVNSSRKIYEKKKEAQRTLARIEEEANILKERQEFLENSLQKLKTEEGIAFEIRKKLNVAQAGEGVAIIVEEEESQNISKTEISFWQKVKNFFTDLFK